MVTLLHVLMIAYEAVTGERMRALSLKLTPALNYLDIGGLQHLLVSSLNGELLCFFISSVERCVPFNPSMMCPQKT